MPDPIFDLPAALEWVRLTYPEADETDTISFMRWAWDDGVHSATVIKRFVVRLNHPTLPPIKAPKTYFHRAGKARAHEMERRRAELHKEAEALPLPPAIQQLLRNVAQ